MSELSERARERTGHDDDAGVLEELEAVHFVGGRACGLGLGDELRREDHRWEGVESAVGHAATHALQ